MRNADQVGELQEGRAAFDCVQRAENLVEEFGIFRACFEDHEITLELLHEFAALGDEVLNDLLVESVGHR